MYALKTTNLLDRLLKFNNSIEIAFVVKVHSFDSATYAFFPVKVYYEIQCLPSCTGL